MNRMPGISFNENLSNALRKVAAKTAEFEALKPLKREDEERLWKKFRLEWNFNSNHIEGNTLTYKETELFLIFDQAPTQPHTGREIEEMRAHDVAVALIREWAADKNRELTEADIRSFNEILLVRPFWKEAITPDGQATQRQITVGEYKTFPNSVRLPNGEIFHYTAPDAVRREMAQLLEWYKKEGPELHPVVTAALLHYRFVRIHPFDDGNGRMARLLLNYHLLRSGLLPIVIKSADKQNYLFALNRADAGDLDAFCAYVAEQFLWSLEMGIKAAKGENVEEPGDWEKELAVLEKSLSKSGKEVQEISNDLVYERLQDSILPLFDLILEKTAQFDRFYVKKASRQSFKPSDRYYECPPEDRTGLILKYHTQRELDKLGEVTQYISWRGLLTNPAPRNDVGINFIVKFQQFQYTVEFLESANKLLQKTYLSPITTAEQKDIVEVVGKYLVDKVKTGSI